MNVVALVGRLTRDPEVKYTQNQLAVTRFSLAVDRQFKKEGQPTADFISITVFGKVAENVGKYMGKGRLVSVSGRIQTRSWDDQSGKKQYATDVIADNVQFLDRAPEGGAVKGPAQSDDGFDFGSGGGGGFQPVEGEDDLPF